MRGHSSVDFSPYKSSTIQRRIIRRMVLTKHETLERYAHGSEFVVRLRTAAGPRKQALTPIW
ncbi:MAG: hypothetical protein ACRDKG_02500 [Actinomycetota bacterium]